MNFHQAEKYIISLSQKAAEDEKNVKKRKLLRLKRLQSLLDVLGNPEKKIPHYLHVAGTSGKGSTCLMLRSVLLEAGKKVGALLSPHPSCVLERWLINGRQMTEKEFVKIIKLMKTKIEKHQPSAFSYGELTTAIGLLFFAQKKVDWTIIEAGCGGGKDATNIIPSKDAAIITNIGLDHTKILGVTKAKIAWEKAGIIKKGALIFNGDKNKKILKIIKKESRKQKAVWKKIDNRFRVLRHSLAESVFQYQNKIYTLPQAGIHQIKNAILVIEASCALKIKPRFILNGLAKVKLPFRLEIIKRHPTVILDSAHNLDKIKTTVQTLKLFHASNQPRINLIVGFSADKNISAMIRQLVKLCPQSIACARNTINPFRLAADPKKIRKQFKKILPSAKIKAFEQPGKAWEWSLKQTKKTGLLLITGSTFLSGEISLYIKNTAPDR